MGGQLRPAPAWPSGGSVTIRCAQALLADVMIRPSRVTNRKASAVTIRSTHGAGLRDDPLLTLGRTRDDPLRSRWPASCDDPAVTRPARGLAGPGRDGRFIG
jgi:hypothetical protein